MSEESEPRNQSETNDASTESPTPHTENISTKIIEHVKANKVDVAMWATRMLTIIFAVSYILPIFGNQQSSFNKVLISNAATSALRLHQRLPTFTLSRDYLSRLFVEDSCHYLMFSLIFFNVTPTLLIIIPIVLFAVLHASGYSLKMLDLIGQNSWWGARFLISLVEFQMSNILRCAAFAEVFIMPLAILFTFMGRSGFMTPVFYYHFIIMRYSSRRNPYTRKAFTELRMATEVLAARSPAFVGKIMRSCIGFVSRLCPQQVAAATAQ